MVSPDTQEFVVERAQVACLEYFTDTDFIKDRDPTQLGRDDLVRDDIAEEIDRRYLTMVDACDELAGRPADSLRAWTTVVPGILQQLVHQDQLRRQEARSILRSRELSDGEVYAKAQAAACQVVRLALTR